MAFSQHTGCDAMVVLLVEVVGVDVLLVELAEVDVVLVVLLVTVEMVLLVVLVVLLVTGSHWPLGLQTASGMNAPPALVQPL